MSTEPARPRVEWTAEDRARHRAVREEFADKPTRDQLLATGAYSGPVRRDQFLALRTLMSRMKEARTARGLSLSDVSDRSGIDRAAISKLENGANLNPTLDTLWRYAIAVGHGISLSAEPSSGIQPEE